MEGVVNGEIIRMVIVDDHPTLREGLRTLLSTQQDFLILGEAATGEEAIVEYKRSKPDILLLDLRLPDMSGVEVITQVRRYDTTAKIIILTTYLGDVQASRSLKAGARGYLVKASLRNHLIEAIRAVQSGRVYVAHEVAKELALHQSDQSLTDREIQVLRLASSGQTNRMLAEQLGIAEETAKGHMRSILGKLGAEDRTHAVTIALQRGFLDL